ncbi:structural protein [Endozoicomonas sp. Mp262]|uniref:structural protein n=1 Tax=Endozoicomonas sp. Mp262 TaxID=2919499 RepID=UPI0021DAD9A3
MNIFDRRGIRNHNPGNIRHGDKWQGLAKSQPDKSFCQFISPEWGVRAMARILINYQKLYGLDTLRKIIYRWAPPTENNSEAYTDHAAEYLCVCPDSEFFVGDHLHELIKCIIKHENGVQPYSDYLIADGISKAVS